MVESRIRMMGITTLEGPHFSYALHSTNDDVDKAVSLLLLLEDSIEGIVRSYTPNIKLLGAENRHGVTCYLDALLFAMFARLDCFDAILYKSFNDEPRRKLAILLRFWVNLLRSGKLITTDIVSWPLLTFLSNLLHSKGPWLTRERRRSMFKMRSLNVAGRMRPDFTSRMPPRHSLS